MAEIADHTVECFFGLVTRFVGFVVIDSWNISRWSVGRQCCSGNTQGGLFIIEVSIPVQWLTNSSFPCVPKSKDLFIP